MFDVVLAGRYDKHSELDDAVFSPRAALVFKPAENHNFRLTYNRAFSTPTSLNLFLDIDAGPLGPLGAVGYRVHAQAPGRDGISLRTNGDVLMRSPVDNALAGITPAAVYDRQISIFASAADRSGQPLGPLEAVLRGIALDPRFGQIALLSSDPLSGLTQPFSSASIRDVQGIKESTTSTIEAGYKGLIGDRILVAADVWWARHKNFTSPLIAATPLLLIESGRPHPTGETAYYAVCWAGYGRYDRTQTGANPGRCRLIQ